jgi:hypothetical protein
VARASRPLARCELGRVAGFGPVALEFKEILFVFLFGLIFFLNFRNSYLIENFFKIYETNSVGFLISSSIYKKYETE